MEQSVPVTKQTIGGVPREKFFGTMNEVMKRFLVMEENPDKSRTGGIMAVKEGDNAIIVEEIMKCLPEKYDAAYKFCQEKVTRLYEYLPEGHMSSWESRDFDNGKYGGAAASSEKSPVLEPGKRVLGSISALVEFGDEAVILVSWIIFGFLRIDEAMKIIEVSDNDLFFPLLRDCEDLY